MMELSWFESVSSGRSALGRLSRGLPLQFDLLFQDRAGAVYTITSNTTLQFDGRARVRFYGTFDPTILERTIEGGITELASQPGSAEFKLQVVVILLIEKRQVRDPIACGRRLAKDRPGKQKQSRAATHVRYDIRPKSRRIAHRSAEFARLPILTLIGRFGQISVSKEHPQSGTSQQKGVRVK
jgi:hypothetical protein